MRFLKDLIHWFVYGTVAPYNKEEAAFEQVAVAVEEPAKHEAAPVDVVQTILAAGRRENFLKELQSIEPISKEFDKAREELIQEIKKLSNQRHA